MKILDSGMIESEEQVEALAARHGRRWRRGEQMSETLSDQEVICGFMEPRPKWTAQIEPHEWQYRWWKWYTDKNHRHLPIPLTLNECHAVEERLTDEQWREYEWQLICVPFDGVVNSMSRVYLHATAEQKIRALAAVLRKEEPQ